MGLGPNIDNTEECMGPGKAWSQAQAQGSGPWVVAQGPGHWALAHGPGLWPWAAAQGLSPLGPALPLARPWPCALYMGNLSVDSGPLYFPLEVQNRHGHMKGPWPQDIGPCKGRMWQDPCGRDFFAAVFACRERGRSPS